MNKSDITAPRGTPEYVVQHARWQRSRGRRPSEPYGPFLNPRVALEAARADAAHAAKNMAILDQVVAEALAGAFTLPCSPDIVGMVVFTVGGQYDMRVTVEVVDVDTGSGTATCQPVNAPAFVAPVSDLRDPNALFDEVKRRVLPELDCIAMLVV